LGLCYGMQLAVVEYARHVVGLKNAHSTECDPKTPHPVIHMIPDQERILENRAYGGTMRLGSWDCLVTKGSLADYCYQKYGQYDDPKNRIASERHRHRYEFNDAYAAQLEKAGLVISGRSVKENLVELIELPRILILSF
jgi:CTP synthase